MLRTAARNLFPHTPALPLTPAALCLTPDSSTVRLFNGLASTFTGSTSATSACRAQGESLTNIALYDTRLPFSRHFSKIASLPNVQPGKRTTSRTYNQIRSYSVSSGGGDHAAEGFSTLSKLLLLLPVAFTFGLGTWQLQRREWKTKLLNFRQEQLNQTPLSLKDVRDALYQRSQQPPEELDTLSANLEYRKVSCEGTLDLSKARFIGPRVKSVCGLTKNGYLMIVPLLPSDGSAPVLINRGWVPSEWKEAFLKGDYTQFEASPVPIRACGAVRFNEQASALVPDNEPANGQWFWIDVPGLATVYGLDVNTTPLLDILLDEGVSPDLKFPPVGKASSGLLTFPVMPQNHLNYACTWYTLSLAVAIMCYQLFTRKPSKRPRLPSA